MEARKFIIFLSTLIGTLWVPILVSAYANQTTHPALTDEAVDLFNNYYTAQKISEADKNLIKQGSVEEDEAPRWMNHFYDPVHNNGLSGFDSSKVYAQNWPYFYKNSANVKPLNLEGQYIWQRAIYDYAYGNKNYAMLALGHVIHLVEDKAVPDHTRNDAHPPIFDQESPYEKWASKFTDTNITTAIDLISKNLPPIILGTLDNYFDELANYSNKNFFSKDTVLSKDYLEPRPGAEKNIGDQVFITGEAAENKGVLLAEKTIATDKKTLLVITTYSIKDKNEFVSSGYWSHLSPQAVRYSSGVIKLFFDEVEKEKQTRVLFSRNKSYTELALEKAKQLASVASTAFSFLKNNLNFPINKNVLTSSVINIPEEVVEQINRPEFIEIVNQQNPKPKPNTVSTPLNTEILINAQEEVLQNNSGTSSTTTPLQAPPANLFFVSLPSPGFGGGSYTAPNPIIVNGDSENILETILPEPVTTETATTTATTTEEIIIVETLPEGSATSTATTTEETIPIEIPEPLSVVINEVAWAGTSAGTANDEWVELYNKTTEEINLNGWVLYSQTDTGPYINLTGTIPAKGFYLIERTDDEAVSDITADWFGSFGNGLSNGGESLVLSYASTTIDQTYMCASLILSNKWPPCNDYKYRTMERVDVNIAGDIFNNWGHAISPSLIKNGKNSNDEEILGTPKSRNSVTYLVNGGAQDMTQDIILKKENSPYLVRGSWLIIKNGTTLTIEPGVVIKFYNGGNMAGITVVDGKILALGTNEEKIIFTSYYDDEYGGDMDGTPLTESWDTSGAWSGIGIYSPGTILDNVVIRSGSGGVYYGTPMPTRTALVVRSYPFSLKNSTIEFSWSKGFELSNATSTIENNIFQFNNNATEADATGATISGGVINLLSNKFLNNTAGLEINYAAGIVDGNFFENNITPLKTSGSSLSFTNNIGIENDALIIIPEATTTPEEII